MKTFILALAALATLPSLASAAPVEVLEAVLRSEALNRHSTDGRLDVMNVKETAIFRCPGCFTIEVTLGRNENARAVSFNTRLAGFDGGRRRYEVTQKEEAGSSFRCIALGRVGGEDRACAKHTSKSACESLDKWERCAWLAN